MAYGRLWSEDDKRTLEKMWADGSSPLEVSKALNRTVQAVLAAVTCSTLRRDFPRNGTKANRAAQEIMIAKWAQHREQLTVVTLEPSGAAYTLREPS